MMIDDLFLIKFITAMAIPWTDDTNQDREQLRIGTDELDSQSNFTNYNFVSQSRSARELRSQSNTERHDDDSFIGTTHSSEYIAICSPIYKSETCDNSFFLNSVLTLCVLGHVSTSIHIMFCVY